MLDSQTSGQSKESVAARPYWLRGAISHDPELRRKDLDVSSRVLNELASREQALDAQIEAARQDAQREVAAAEAEAARILSEAQARAKDMTAQREREMEAEAQRVREEASAQAQREAQASYGRSEGKLGSAVETILRAVLP